MSNGRDFNFESENRRGEEDSIYHLLPVVVFLVPTILASSSIMDDDAVVRGRIRGFQRFRTFLMARLGRTILRSIDRLDGFKHFNYLHH